MMDSWRDVNYKTGNRTAQMVYFNMSTADWRIGFLPANLTAIPGSINDYPSNLTNSSLVIEYAGEKNMLGRPIESGVFGIAAGAVILWAIGWFLLNRKSFFQPSSQENAPGEGNADAEAAVNGESKSNPYNIQGFLSASEFRHRLDTHYYEPVVTELELAEKSPNQISAFVDPADIEATASLLRDMYRMDMRLNGLQNAGHVSEADRENLRRGSEAAWEEVTSTVKRWTKAPEISSWSKEEHESWRGILTAITGTGAKRYSPRR